MDIPRGYAAIPLQELDFLDFIYNYFKAEYAPIRSFWSTATAVPTLPSRWINMGHDLSPLAVRPANAQAQKDIESLDFFTRKWNLDANFVRGLVVRYAKYEVHDRLERTLFESGRLDLMIRKSLKEKHLIDALWPSPAPRNLPTELLQQGVQVRKWYGDMFHKYFRVLHSVDQFQLLPDVDAKMKSAERLMLIPFVDHLVFGSVDPIMPIVAMGAGFTKAKGSERKKSKTLGYGEPEKFEIRFDAPADVTDTYTKSVARQCQCMKCGTKRDVQVVISIDPNLEFGTSSTGLSASRANDGGPPSAQKRNTSKTAQKYSPGYNMPGEQEPPPRLPQRPQAESQEPEAPRASSPERKKQCPRCTFLNHPELTSCEMCQADLPDIITTKPPSPPAATVPSNISSNLRKDTPNAGERPTALNRNSVSQSLLSMFPFSQQQQQPQQQQSHPTKSPPSQYLTKASVSKPTAKSEIKQDTQRSLSKPEKQIPPTTNPAPLHAADPSSSPTTTTTTATTATHRPTTPPLSRAPEMAMMPLTPPSTTSPSRRQIPTGLPSNLMDDFVPIASPGFAHEQEEDVDAGWGEMSREEASKSDDDDDDEGDDDGHRDGKRGRRGFVDLDAVAREEADVWGEREMITTMG